jgi:hypothetical protein
MDETRAGEALSSLRTYRVRGRDSPRGGGDGDGSDSAGGRDIGGQGSLSQDEIVDALAKRLISSRLQEVEHLDRKIGELGEALRKVEAIRLEIDACVKTDVQSAARLAEDHLGGRIDTQQRRSFSEFFSAFLGIFSRSRRA